MSSSSKDAYIQIPSFEGNSTLRTLAYMIIFSLRYYGCDVESIFRVLRSYGFNDTRDSIARYIEEDKIIEHLDEHWHPNEGKKVHTRRMGMGITFTVVAIDFARGLPTKIKINCRRLPALTPTEYINVQAADGRKISTSVTSGQVLCQICGLEGLHSSDPHPQALGSKEESSS